MTEQNDDQVKLKPILGMRPGVYLTILYSFLIILIIFLFLILPGLKNPAAALVVKTNPTGAGIRVNDVYMGLAGSKIIIPKGTHTITAVMPGFEEKSEVHTIQPRIFGSHFFPRIYEIDIQLKTNNAAEAFTIYAGEFAQWSFMGEPTSPWQIPLVLSDGAYRFGSYQNNDLHEILKASARFTSTRAALRDLIRAKTLLDNNGSSPSPVSLLKSIKDAAVFLSETPDSALWLAGLLPNETAKKIEDSGWFNKNATKHLKLPDASIQRSINLAGINFIEIKTDKNFMISESPVSSSLFEEFLNAAPQWREHKTDYVPEEITVNPFESFQDGAVTGITWYAADAFCKWFTSRLPASMSNMIARLPAEDEWYASSFVIENMNVPGWEWCEDYYAPRPQIKAQQKAIEAVGSPERLLCGSPSPSISKSRASLPPDLSSPFVTFRVALTEKE